MGKMLEALTVVQRFELLAKRAGSLSRCSHSRLAFAALHSSSFVAAAGVWSPTAAGICWGRSAVPLPSACKVVHTWLDGGRQRPPTCKPTAICICKMWCT